jgi:fatty acid desaturase
MIQGAGEPQMSTAVSTGGPAFTVPGDPNVSPLAHLSAEQLDRLAEELDAIRDRVMADLGERDRRYIESMIEMQRRFAVLGRLLLLASRNRAAWVAGTSALAAAKILENMEIGHNVLHGQWDWMNDPRIHSSTWEWDIASPARGWKHYHNYLHHTYTNIRGKTRISATRSCGSTRSRCGSPSTSCSPSTTCS